ncbi:LacI family DNA-binding transcriptional regulator [Vibrio tapetis subsp. quintayensis]|uniref:LacI family DNA-binding transcriptional regulator n=1 Tax=Vibrio tapetis TaxID=52443 RepID=UPI0025B31167|nr:LacI family DNA-binding transcriptional regulator [Vibrio tapetis]MDN3682063.1 LacI family DNA-binding transcriptional regulator [Vibrio tapetis subsp. quintayensis]
MSVTFKDVANLAGVSTQTVSRVTNGAENVAETTRKKVNHAIKQLGYVPNKGAQMLSRAKSKIVGVVSLDISLHGVALIDSGIRAQANDKGYATALAVVERGDVESIRSAMRELIAQQVEAIIINAPLTQKNAEGLVEQFQHIHLIFIDVPDQSKVNYVCAAHKEGAKLAARHLLDAERSQFILITGPNESTASQVRYQSWCEQISHSELAQVVWQHEGDWQAHSGYLAIRDAIAKKCSFDAVLVAGDQMALGVLSALHEFGLSVPEQVSVVGFDGIKDSAYFTPSLSTIEQDFHLIGQKAVNLALQSVSAIPLQEVIPVRLLARDSSRVKRSEEYNRERVLTLIDELKNMLQ